MGEDAELLFQAFEVGLIDRDEIGLGIVPGLAWILVIAVKPVVLVDETAVRI